MIIGSGPSLSCSQIGRIYTSRLHDGCRVIAVNDNYQLAPWADVLYACDYGWFVWHEKHLFIDSDILVPKLMVTVDEPAAKKWPRLKWVPGTNKPGLSLDPELLHYGRNGGYQAINLATLLGAKTILLVGFDQCFPGNQAHWFGDHPSRTRSMYERWTECWQGLPPQLKELGIELINCTPDSALTVFPMRPLKKELESI